MKVLRKAIYHHPGERLEYLLVELAGIADALVFILSLGFVIGGIRAYVMFDLLIRE